MADGQLNTADRENRMEEALRHIRNWCEAYPIEAFPEPDLTVIRAQIGDGPMAALHAHWARHLLEGIARHAQKGLQG